MNNSIKVVVFGTEDIANRLTINTKSQQVAVIDSLKNVNVAFINEATNHAPDHIITTRAKDDLQITFDTDKTKPDLIIKNFYLDEFLGKQSLVGITESKDYHFYIPDTGLVTDYHSVLEDGVSKGHVLGGDSTSEFWTVSPSEVPLTPIVTTSVATAGLLYYIFRDNQPETSKPETSKPETSKPETSKPETSKSETNKPETNKPETSKPETNKPENNEPENNEPENNKPEAVKPSVQISDAQIIEGYYLNHEVKVMADTSGPLTYSFSLTNGTAAQDDYTNKPEFSNGVINNGNGTITIPEGVTKFAVRYLTTRDKITESNETTKLTIDNIVATGTIINGNNVPVAVYNFTHTNEDKSTSGNVITDLSKGGKDSDLDNDPLKVVKFKIKDTEYEVGQTATIENIGEFVLKENGDYNFTPITNYNGNVPYIFYTITDGKDESEATHLKIRINPVNDRPVAIDNSKTIHKNTNAEGNVISDEGADGKKDSDIDGDALEVLSFTVNNKTYDASEQPVTVTGVGKITIKKNGDYSFVPDSDYTGNVPKITYMVTDNKLGSSNNSTDTAELEIIVNNSTATAARVQQNMLFYVDTPKQSGTIKTSKNSYNAKLASTQDDTLKYNELDTLDGGIGFDTLLIGDDTTTGIDLSNVLNIEKIDMSNGTQQTITLSESDVISSTDANNTLFVKADSNDSVTLPNFSKDTANNQSGYSKYSNPTGNVIIYLSEETTPVL